MVEPISQFPCGPFLKRDAPESFKTSVDEAEHACDQAFRQLTFWQRPRAKMLLMLLNGFVDKIEAARAMANGDTDHPVFSQALMLWGPVAGLACKTALELCLDSGFDLETFAWSDERKQLALAALDEASKYDVCRGHFPGWHVNEYTIEIPEQDRLIFDPCCSEFERRVIAFRQGFRHPEWPADRKPLKPPSLTPDQKQLWADVLSGVGRDGTHSPRSDRAMRLFRQLKPHHRTRLASTARWDDETRLEQYSLKEFREVYAALLAVASLQESICQEAYANKRYKLRTSILVRSRNTWTSLLAEVSKVDSRTTEHIINQLTLTPCRTPNLFVTPFVRLSQSTNSLAMVAHAVLGSKVEENILRVFSRHNKAAYDVLSNDKHRSMTEKLIGELPRGSLAHASVHLQRTVPDIDLLVEQLDESCVLVSELKWERNYVDYYEQRDRDAGFAKGQKQLAKIKEFLLQNPDALQVKGKLSRSLNDYKVVYFLLIGRDHFVWPLAGENPVVDYEIFIAALRKQQNLLQAVQTVVDGRWLPREGREFTVGRSAITVGGVTLVVPDHRRIPQPS